MSLPRLVPFARRVSLPALSAIALATLLGTAKVSAQAGATPPAAVVPAPGKALVGGTVLDSLRGGTLENAIIQLMSADRVAREAITRKDGKFLFRDVEPGSYTLRMLHNTLDTVGFVIVSPKFTATAGGQHAMNMSVPTARSLVARKCSAGELARGPSAVFGFVRDPDTNMPVVGAEVMLDASATDPFGLIRTPAIRRVQTDTTGRFKICGLPDAFSGKLVATLRGVSSGDVPVTVRENWVSLRGLTFSVSNRLVTIKGDSGKIQRYVVGRAKLKGKVINERGEPLADARVSVLNSLSQANTDKQGQFTLDSLPSGSITVEIRKIGYGITQRPVDVSNAELPTSATLTMDKMPTILAPMTTRADAHTMGLEHVGYNERKRTAIGGVFRAGPDELMQMSSSVSQMLRGIPGLKIRREDTGDGIRQVIETTTRGIHDCLNIWVDMMYFKQLEPGDLDNFISADEVEAIEFYSTSQVPGEYFGKLGGKTGCAVLQFWTRHTVPRKGG